MPEDPIQIKRYPNRRLYSRRESRYVSLQEIAEMIRAGHKVEIRDSQSGEDLTRAVLVQIILDQPEKMSLFPVEMLHFIVQSNDMMAGFLRTYFSQALAYLEYLQSQGASAAVQPMHWMSGWLESLTRPPSAQKPPDQSAEAELAERVEQLEERLRQLEAAQGGSNT